MSGVVALVIALATLVTAVTALVGLFRKVAAVHTLVNRRMDEAMDYQATLIKALTSAGVDVPDGAAGQPDA